MKTIGVLIMCFLFLFPKSENQELKIAIKEINKCHCKIDIQNLSQKDIVFNKAARHNKYFFKLKIFDSKNNELTGDYDVVRFPRNAARNVTSNFMNLTAKKIKHLTIDYCRDSNKKNPFSLEKKEKYKAILYYENTYDVKDCFTEDCQNAWQGILISDTLWFTFK